MKKPSIVRRHHHIIRFAIGYLLIHLVSPLTLPVFADEAIYIRWAQLIIDDWRQYLFFPLNDGKTPAFIWLLVPFQFLVDDQLLAGRLSSILIGAIQAWVMSLIAKNLGLSKRYQFLTMGLTVLLPYWYFHHHLALMDGMLTLWLSLSVLITIKIINQKEHRLLAKDNIINSLLVGLFLGLAILTKIPALLFIPSLFVFAFLLDNKQLAKKSKTLILLSCSVVFALIIFALLKFHPAFGQLFSRGGDFLFSWQEVFFESKWRETLPSWPTYFGYFARYLTWPIFFLSILGVFLKNKKISLAVNLAWLAYAIPIMLLGKVVFARYLFSVSIFITLGAVISIAQLIKMNKFVKTVTCALILLSLIQSTKFILAMQIQPKKMSLTSSDRQQYLTEWSAGYGVKETVGLINELSRSKTVYVLCEGYFGTLPDGLLMYFHRKPVDNFFIQPIGQPITKIEPAIITRAQDYDITLLVANSHRIHIDLSQAKLLLDVCRPFNAPCHQVWDITKLVKP